MLTIDIEDADEIRTLTDQQILDLRGRLEVEYARRFTATTLPPEPRMPQVGAKVRTKGNLSPKYIVGRTGSVAAVNRTTADVTLDDWTRVNARYIQERYGVRFVRIPIKCLEVI